MMSFSKALTDIYGIIDKECAVFSFDKVCWTSYFTINRMKTICKLNEDFITVDNVMYPSWLEKYWSKLSEGERQDAHNYFGKYSLYFFFHWICYSHQRLFTIAVYQRFGFRRDRQFEILYHLSRHRDLYLDNTDIENVFRYSVSQLF